MNTQQCKELISKECKKNPALVTSQFIDQIDPALSFNPKNWTRIEKFIDSNRSRIIRGFDCKPYDDQLRAYVETDLHGNFISLKILGE